VRDLISAELFSGIEVTARTAVSELLGSKQTITIISEANLLGSLSIAPIEAALLESKSQYRRRLGNTNPGEMKNCILIDTARGGKGIEWNPERNILTITETMSMALSGHQGDSKVGPLTTVAICHCIAQIISPSGSNVRRMRPWAVSGNWIHQCMDMTYDPVYASLKDTLRSEGTIRVVPITEVPMPNVENLDFINSEKLQEIASRWDSMGEEGRARSISHLCRKVLQSTKPSTSRLEEIVWNCIMAPGWQSDLASQIRGISSIWKDKDKKIASSMIIDSLIRNGKL
tara:strand:+ start:21 stop:881 length:861 start_codon:yes stop_codon:yes gene_type:complete